MRVTNRMTTSSFLRDLNKNLNSLNKMNNQLTSGKEVSRPSDNPFKVSRIMQLNNDINLNDQYKENIKDALNWMDTTDTALGQINDSMQRVRELMVSVGNATYDQNQMTSIKEEINERIKEIGQVLNTSFDGKYIFGGTKTSSKPVRTEVDVDGNALMVLNGKNGETIRFDTKEYELQNQLMNMEERLNVEISKGVKIDYSINAVELLKIQTDDGEELNFMDLASEILSNLGDSNNWQEVYTNNLGKLDLFMNNVNRLRSEVGAKENRMTSAEMQNEEINYNLTNLLSNIQDIDYAEKSIEIAELQAVYIASLQASAKIIKPTLLDYLG